MLIGVTGATGFLGRYIVEQLVGEGHRCRCWHRPTSDRGGFDDLQDSIEWIPGGLCDEAAAKSLVHGVDAVVHAALDRAGVWRRNEMGGLIEFAELNLIGTLRLIDAAKSEGVGRFIFISSCAVHEVVLEDRPLDEAHPMWSLTHYGAHKAAIEAFVSSFGRGEGMPICALRPTGIYGVARPVQESKWYEVIQKVKRGEPIASPKGGKEVHAGDVARAVSLLLAAEGIAGQAYNCYDRYVAEQDVALIARELTGSDSEITPLNKGPKHQIDTSKLRSLGMAFGGEPLLESTIGELLEMDE